MTRQAQRITKKLYLCLDVIGVCLVLAVMNWGGYNSYMTVIGLLAYFLTQALFDRWIMPVEARRGSSR